MKKETILKVICIGGILFLAISVLADVFVNGSNLN